MSKSERFINGCDQLMAFSFYALIYFLPVSIALSETFTGLSFFAYLLKRGAVFYSIGKYKKQMLLENSFPMQQRRYDERSEEFSCGLLKGGGAGEDKTNISVWRKLWMAYKPVPNPPNISIYIFPTANLTSAAPSQYLLLSIEGFIGKVLQSVFLYFNFVECMHSNKRIKAFLGVLLVSCTLIVMNGIYQYYAEYDFFFGHVYSDRLYSSFRHPNDFGAYLVMLIPILFCITFLFKTAPKEKGQAQGGLAYFSSGRTRMLTFILFL